MYISTQFNRHNLNRNVQNGLVWICREPYQLTKPAFFFGGDRSWCLLCRKSLFICHQKHTVNVQVSWILCAMKVVPSVYVHKFMWWLSVRWIKVLNPRFESHHQHWEQFWHGKFIKNDLTIRLCFHLNILQKFLQ